MSTAARVAAIRARLDAAHGEWKLQEPEATYAPRPLSAVRRWCRVEWHEQLKPLRGEYLGCVDGVSAENEELVTHAASDLAWLLDQLAAEEAKNVRLFALAYPETDEHRAIVDEAARALMAELDAGD